MYVEPLPNRYFLQFCYSYQYQVTNSDHFVYNWDEAMEDFVADYDSLASNSFETLFYGTCYPAIEYDGEKVKNAKSWNFNRVNLL